eukprot:6199701-Amphidinium_carterae.1
MGQLPLQVGWPCAKHCKACGVLVWQTRHGHMNLMATSSVQSVDAEVGESQSNRTRKQTQQNKMGDLCFGLSCWAPHQ